MENQGDDEIVWGAKGCAPIIGRTERQTFHLLEAGKLPAVKIGGRWAARKSALLATFNPNPVPRSP